MTTSAEAWLDDVRELLIREYGIAGTLSVLPGENRNVLVETPGGTRYVFKLASDERTSELLKFEHAIVEHLSERLSDFGLPRTVKTLAGGRIEGRLQTAAGDMHGRLIEFVSGTPWGEVSSPSGELFADLGRTLASVDLALTTFRHPFADRTHRWDLARADQHRGKISLIEPGRRRLVEHCFHLWAASAKPRLAARFRWVIYGDANDENVLVRDGRVAGLVDFGDALKNPVICDLAIAIVYATLGREDPLGDAAEIVGGYYGLRRLEKDELDVLFALMCGRLATSVVVAAERRLIDSGNANWFVTEERAWRAIERLVAIDPADARRRLSARVRTLAVPVSSIEAQIWARREHVAPSLSISYRRPIAMVRGEGQYLFDNRGRPYLDLVNNVCHVGHCHPRVVEAGQRQKAQLNTNTRYIYDELSEYARRLTATLPKPLEVCYFVNSGSEANELALRLARARTHRHDVLVVDGAYHGNTTSLIAISPYKFKGKGGSGRAEPWVHVAPIPDGYRGTIRGADRVTGSAYGDEVGKVLADARQPVAAFMVESIMSCAGQVVPPPGYLETAFAHVRSAGAVTIVDEVQTGFGRVGSHFWGFETHGVVPDIVVMGKPIGNGHPIGAVVTTREIAASFDNGMEFFSTFGGNPVSCAIGLAVLDVIEDEQLQARARAAGQRFLNGLRVLQDKHELVGDVRGAGLFIGVELVRNRATLEPAAGEASDLINRLRERGILLSTDGPFHNVLKIKPPLVLSDDDIDMAVRVLDDELGSLS